MVTNASFIGRVEKGIETFVYITELAVIIILDQHCVVDLPTAARTPVAAHSVTPNELRLHFLTPSVR